MIYDVTFKDTKKDGSTIWKRVGVAGSTDKGMYVKLDSIPVGFDGWLSLFPKDENKTTQEPQSGIDKARQVANQIKAKQNIDEVHEVFDNTPVDLDSIPF